MPFSEGTCLLESLTCAQSSLCIFFLSLAYKVGQAQVIKKCIHWKINHFLCRWDKLLKNYYVAILLMKIKGLLTLFMQQDTSFLVPQIWGYLSWIANGIAPWLSHPLFWEMPDRATTAAIKRVNALAKKGGLLFLETEVCIASFRVFWMLQ